MNDETLFQLAVEITIAKIRTHFTSPSIVGHDEWIADQIHARWSQLRELWHDGHHDDNVQPLG